MPTHEFGWSDLFFNNKLKLVGYWTFTYNYKQVPLYLFELNSEASLVIFNKEVRGTLQRRDVKVGGQLKIND